MATAQKQAFSQVVTIDPEAMHGTASFANTRVPVQTFIDFLETGDSVDDFIKVFPYIPREFLELSRDIVLG
jgi:uncharacterized protein (DUF433 family)